MLPTGSRAAVANQRLPRALQCDAQLGDAKGAHQHRSIAGVPWLAVGMSTALGVGERRIQLQRMNRKASDRGKPDLNGAYVDVSQTCICILRCAAVLKTKALQVICALSPCRRPHKRISGVRWSR